MCSAVNELDLLSKQSEVKCMNETANDVNLTATNLFSVLIQPISCEVKSPCVRVPA